MTWPGLGRSSRTTTSPNMLITNDLCQAPRSALQKKNNTITKRPSFTCILQPLILLKSPEGIPKMLFAYGSCLGYGVRPTMSVGPRGALRSRPCSHVFRLKVTGRAHTRTHIRTNAATQVCCYCWFGLYERSLSFPLS